MGHTCSSDAAWDPHKRGGNQTGQTVVKMVVRKVVKNVVKTVFRTVVKQPRPSDRKLKAS